MTKETTQGGVKKSNESIKGEVKKPVESTPGGVKKSGETTPGDVKKSDKVFPIALAFVCVALLAGGYMLARYTETDLVTLLIISVVAAVAIGSGFYVVFKLKQSNTKIAVTLLALLLSSAVSTAIGNWLQVEETAQKRQEQEQAEKAAAAARAAMLKNAAKRADANANKAADTAEYTRFENALINKSESMRSEYLRAMDATGWSRLLDTDRLRADKSLVESKAILQKARDVAAKYRAQNLAMHADALKEIAALKIGDSSMQKILSVFGSGGGYSADALGTLWDCMDKQIAEYEAIFTQLSNKKVNWMAQNGKVLFSEQSDLDVFDAHLGAAREAAKKGDALREQLSEALSISFEEPKPAETKSGDAKPDEVKSADVKPDATKADAPKLDAPKAEAPKADSPKK